MFYKEKFDSDKVNYDSLEILLDHLYLVNIRYW